MKSLRWIWPIMGVALLILLPWGCYRARDERRFSIAVVDKTVPYANRIEHRSLFWLLDHLKIVRPDGRGYDRDWDYRGAFPGPTPGDPPWRTTDLDPETARSADLIYFADTYGVYRDDLVSKEAMRAALERSPKIYGGLTAEEAEAAAEAIGAGKTVVAEFNTFASPTDTAVRERMEALVGVRWTRWIGRFFERLENRDEVPQWLRHDYESEWHRPWEFEGPGYVLVQDDARVEVLRVGAEAEPIALTLERDVPVDPLLEGALDETPYPYWFDVVELRHGAERLASFHWHLKPAGLARLRARGLPRVFPAVVRHRAAGKGAAYYFCGDFADNPMADYAVPLVGYTTLRRWLEVVKLAPAETSFYWRFYVPLVTRLMESPAGVPR